MPFGYICITSCLNSCLFLAQLFIAESELHYVMVKPSFFRAPFCGSYIVNQSLVFRHDVFPRQVN